MSGEKIITEAAALKDLDFEDIYISSTGEFNFVNHTGKVVKIPDGYDGPPPKTEVLYLLSQLVKNGQAKDEFTQIHDDIRYRVATIRSIDQIWYVLRRATRGVPLLTSFKGLDYFKDNLINMGRREGLILAVGPTGSGKTTFLSSLLKTYLQTHGGMAVTIEDPPELELHGEYENGRCYQQHFMEHEFPRGLKAALRFRPRYIMIGELRSKEAAMTAIQASITGHVVMATMHAGSISQAILNLSNMASGGSSNDLVWRSIAEGLNGVIMLKRHKSEKSPETKLFLLPPTGAEGVRQSIRMGQIESLKNDIENSYNRINAKNKPSG